MCLLHLEIWFSQVFWGFLIYYYFWMHWRQHKRNQHCDIKILIVYHCLIHFQEGLWNLAPENCSITFEVLIFRNTIWFYLIISIVFFNSYINRDSVKNLHYLKFGVLQFPLLYYNYCMTFIDIALGIRLAKTSPIFWKNMRSEFLWSTVLKWVTKKSIITV